MSPHQQKQTGQTSLPVPVYLTGITIFSPRRRAERLWPGKGGRDRQAQQDELSRAWFGRRHPPGKHVLR
jgi:hypothetical protein